MKDALESVTVLEFGGYAAGPAIGKYLANFGAGVIHLVSTAVLDYSANGARPPPKRRSRRPPIRQSPLRRAGAPSMRQRLRVQSGA